MPPFGKSATAVSNGKSMFIFLPLSFLGLAVYIVHQLIWNRPSQQGNRMLEEYRIREANESNEEDLAKIKKLNLK